MAASQRALSAQWKRCGCLAPAWSCRRKSIAADVLAWLPPSSSRPQFSGVNAGRQMGMYLHGPGHTHLTRVPALRTAPWPASTTVTPPACSRREYYTSKKQIDLTSPLNKCQLIQKALSKKTN